MECGRGSEESVIKKGHRKHKTSKKKRKYDSSGDESVDITEKIFPIAHYLNDREEMIKQVFSVMEREKLNCMLPPILKGMTMSVLKDHCLKELRNMSDDEVRKVLCGEPVELPAAKVTTTLLIDSDSGDSAPSVEECQNEDEEKRTLLDILEQEMQEIAYNTVLNRDKNLPTPESEDELPEVVAIIPTSSPSRAKSNVPLICIDSEDEGLAESASSPPPQLNSSDERCHASRSLDDCTKNDGTPQLHSPSSIVIEEPDLEKEQSTNGSDSSVNQATIDASNQSDHQPKSSSNSNEVSSEAQENFLIQVFSNKASTVERVVKKVLKTSERDVDKILSVSRNPHKADINKLNSEKLKEGANSSSQGDHQMKMDKEVVVLQIPEETISDDLAPQVISIAQPEPSTEQLNSNCDTNSISQLVETCINLKTSDLSPDQRDVICSENLNESKEDAEKEEGEISEDESEEDIEILETARDRHRSPTVFLSSDGDDVKSDSEKSETPVRVRKHHHRHRRSRRKVSPERSKRRIEKRGNRSYRRRTSSSVKRSCSPAGKGKKLSEESSALESTICSPNKGTETTEEDSKVKETDSRPSEAVCNLATPTDCISETSDGHNKSESAKSNAEESVEMQSSENIDIVKQLEDKLPENKLDSSEEGEEPDIAEPVATKTSWADRWAEKKDLKKVVITSKICQNVRKRILSARKKKQSNQEASTVPVQVLPPVPPLVLHVEGSVQEYQMLQLLDVCDEELRGSTSVDSKGSTSEVSVEVAPIQGEGSTERIGTETIGTETITDLKALSEVPLPDSIE